MKNNAVLSRRGVLGSLGASTVLAATVTPAEAASADAHLLTLGRAFDDAATQLDHAMANGTDVDWQVLEQLGRLDAKIVGMAAFSMEGLFVKARAACWALLGDLDPAAQSTTDKRMALSMVRDLIRLYDPGLERPGALKKLVEDIESGAGNSVTRESTS
jgi:hypothetical protein